MELPLYSIKGSFWVGATGTSHIQVLKRNHRRMEMTFQSFSRVPVSLIMACTYRTRVLPRRLYHCLQVRFCDKKPGAPKAVRGMSALVRQGLSMRTEL